MAMSRSTLGTLSTWSGPRGCCCLSSDVQISSWPRPFASYKNEGQRSSSFQHSLLSSPLTVWSIQSATSPLCSCFAPIDRSRLSSASCRPTMTPRMLQLRRARTPRTPRRYCSIHSMAGWLWRFLSLVAEHRTFRLLLCFVASRAPCAWLVLLSSWLGFTESLRGAMHASLELTCMCGRGQGAAGATQQKASETGAFAQDKGVQAKDGAGSMLQQAGDAVSNAAQSVADTVNPNKSG